MLPKRIRMNNYSSTSTLHSISNFAPLVSYGRIVNIHVCSAYNNNKIDYEWVKEMIKNEYIHTLVVIVVE